MMNVSPVCTQPSTVIRETLEIFEGDFASNAIEYSFLVEQSYKTAMVDWAMLDPYRVTQILVNLTTNAIKFTRLEEKRVITVFITKPPHFQGASLQWFPSSKADLKKDPTLRADWGQGKPVFLFFAVQDTGRGLDQEERMRLFNRFAVSFHQHCWLCRLRTLIPTTASEYPYSRHLRWLGYWFVDLTRNHGVTRR